MEKEGLITELRQFLDDEGRLTKIPVKRKKKLAFLSLLAPRFETGRTYTEKEINAVINEHHTFGDPVTFRRELIEHGILSRDRAGTEYRRSEELPTFEELLHRYG